MPLRLNDIHLCETAIHKQFRSSDVAAVVVREKHHGLCDLLGRTDPAERHDACNHLPPLLARFCGSQQVGQSRRVDGAWAQGVHANATTL
jgi:hypothetical protein